MLVAIPISAAVVAGCATAKQDQPSAAAAAAAPTPSAAPTTGSVASSSTTADPNEDYEAKAGDFVNVHDMTAVRGFFISNELGHLDEALKVVNDPNGGTYPVGTIIQLVPQEAMVKRKAGFAPDGGDWEFFQLTVTPTGTEIKQRGTGEIKNLFNQSCGACHMKADIKFDFVCEKSHGCDPLPMPDTFFKNLQDHDPRPRQSHS